MAAVLHKATVGAPSTTQMFPDNPRHIVTELIRENPKKSKEELFDKFRERVRRSEGYRRAIEWYFFANMYEYMCSARNVKDNNKKPLDKDVAKLKDRVVAVVLLDLVLPNGKLLRDASGAECTKAGGWLAEIGKRVAPRNIVGNVMSESELQEIWKAVRGKS